MRTFMSVLTYRLFTSSKFTVRNRHWVYICVDRYNMLAYKRWYLGSFEHMCRHFSVHDGWIQTYANWFGFNAVDLRDVNSLYFCPDKWSEELSTYACDYDFLKIY